MFQLFDIHQAIAHNPNVKRARKSECVRFVHVAMQLMDARIDDDILIPPQSEEGQKEYIYYLKVSLHNLIERNDDAPHGDKNSTVPSKRAPSYVVEVRQRSNQVR